MDHNDPPIIKSGSRHTVQVSQGTKNAKSVRNVVTSDVDAPLDDRFVQAQETEQRAAANMQQTGPLQEQALDSGTAWVGEGSAVAGGAATLVDEPAPSAAQTVVFEDPAQAPVASQGPVVLQQERGDEDARAAKAGVEGEHRVLIEEQNNDLADRMVQDTSSAVQDNRQRIERLQAQANRIRLDNELRAGEGPEHAKPGERVLGTLEVSAAQEPPKAAPPAPTAPLPVVSAPVAAEVELPPEVSANLDHGRTADASKESDLMARLRALKSNMSVTETRLTKLKTPEPPTS